MPRATSRAKALTSAFAIGRRALTGDPCLGPQRLPGRPCGEVLGAADDLAKADQKDSIVRQAASSIGKLPGHVTRVIEQDSNPTQDWRELLRQ